MNNKDTTEKEPKVHYVFLDDEEDYIRKIACGLQPDDVLKTNDGDDVTCPICKPYVSAEARSYKDLIDDGSDF